MSFEENINKENIILPKAAAPVGSYVAFKIVGKLLYISGQISIDKDGNLIKGKLGKDLKTEDGYKAAVRCALNIVAQAKNACKDDLSKIKSCVKLTGFVNSTDDFTEQPKVINGASDLIEIENKSENNSILVPFTREIVPKVDIKNSIVIIDPPKGLL